MLPWGSRNYGSPFCFFFFFFLLLLLLLRRRSRTRRTPFCLDVTRGVRGPALAGPRAIRTAAKRSGWESLRVDVEA
jgi:hypothetical protein